MTRSVEEPQERRQQFRKMFYFLLYAFSDNNYGLTAKRPHDGISAGSHGMSNGTANQTKRTDGSEAMRAIEVPEPGGGFDVVERPRPEPATGEVQIEVATCGICHGDTTVTEGRPPIEYPRTPGHEIAGEISAVGEGVTSWEPGDRVAVGWHGGHCFACPQCRRGDFVNCEREQITGIHSDGGYAEYATAPTEALVSVPDALSLTAAGPLVCAGLTAYSGLAHSDATPGDTVGILGIGGVGHMGIQFADASGFETVALSRGTAKAETATDLGADHYVDTEAADPAEKLTALGGADAILATAPSSDAIESVIQGLAPNGELIAVGAPDDPVSVPIPPMLGNRWTVTGWSAGHAGDAGDALAAAARNGVSPWIESYPLADTGDAFDRLLSGRARFKPVLEP